MKKARDVVHTMMQAALVQDLTVIVGCLDENVVCVEPVSLAYGGVTRGRDAFLKDVFGAIVTKCEMAIANLELIGDGDVVAVAMDINFKSRKTGVAILMPYVELYTVRNEKIVNIRVYPQDVKRLVEFWNAN